MDSSTEDAAPAGPYEIAIVGAGLAGSIAAYRLGAHRKTVLIEADRPGGGASGAAAGLLHRFLGTPPRPVWRSDESLAGIRRLLKEIGGAELFEERGILRPATDGKEAATLEEVAKTHAPHLGWLPPEAVTERFSDLEAPRGGLLEPEGGALRIPRFCEELVAAFEQAGGTYVEGRRVTGIRHQRGAVELDLEEDSARVEEARPVRAGTVLLAVGAGYQSLPILRNRGLEPVKGETLTVDPPWNGPPPPSLVGEGYAAVFEDEVVLGSTYERPSSREDPGAASGGEDEADRDAAFWNHLRPTTEGARTIRAKTASLHPSFADQPEIAARAGVRVTAPGHRKAAIGPLPEHERIWMVGGFGSKGLLLGGLLGENLLDWFAEPATIPERLGAPPQG